MSVLAHLGACSEKGRDCEGLFVRGGDRDDGVIRSVEGVWRNVKGCVEECTGWWEKVSGNGVLGVVARDGRVVEF